VLGGVNVGPGGVLSGSIITGTQGNFSGIVRTQAMLNPALGQPISFGSPIEGGLITVSSVVADTGFSYFSSLVVSGEIGGGGIRPLHLANGRITGTANVGYTVNVISSLTVGADLNVAGATTLQGSFFTNNITASTIIATYQLSTPFLYTQNIYNPTSPFSTIQIGGVLRGSSGSTAPLNVTGISMGSILGNLYALITPGQLTVSDVLNANGITQMTGGNITITRANPTTDTALQVNGVAQLPSANVNTALNTSTAKRIGNYINAVTVPGTSISGYGNAPFVFGKMMTSSYSFGVSFAFTNGVGYTIPNFVLSPNDSSYARLVYQSRGNQTGNGAQIYGVWDIYVGFQDGVAGVLQPVFRQNAIFVSNSSINILYDPVSNTTTMKIISNVGSGGFGYVVDVTASWTIQPIFIT
jgi:hypothetical protein